jgi:hypothetical protein
VYLGMRACACECVHVCVCEYVCERGGGRFLHHRVRNVPFVHCVGMIPYLDRPTPSLYKHPLSCVGKRVEPEQGQGSAWTVTFQDNVKVIATKVTDFECGCRCGTFAMLCTVKDDADSVWHNFASAQKIPQVRAVGSKNGDLVFGGMHLDKNSEWTTAAFSKGADAGIHNWPQAIGSHLNTDLTTRNICAVDLAGEIDETCGSPRNGQGWVDSCPNGKPGRVNWWFRMEPRYA